MVVVFIILLLFTTELVYQIATDYSQGFNPYPFGTPIFLGFNHFVLLVMCIYYCGWLCGIALFALHLFAFLHGTFAWVFSIPGILYLTSGILYEFQKAVRIERLSILKIKLLTPTLIINLIFTVLSIFIVPFKSAYMFFASREISWIILAVAALICFILRPIVGYVFSSKAEKEEKRRTSFYDSLTEVDPSDYTGLDYTNIDQEALDEEIKKHFPNAK